MRVGGRQRQWETTNAKPWIDHHQISNTWLGRGHLLPRKIRGQSAQGFCPHMRQICPQNLWMFTSLFRFSQAPIDAPVRPIFTLNTSYDAVLRKEVPFGWEKLILIFNWFMRKKIEKLQWRLWGKFKNYLNCHNSGCTQDRVVLFGAMVWFSGTANLTASFKFTPGWPLLPWQRNLRQNRL